jgi:hypothetical protein
MKPVDQSISDPERGDCQRATIASLLNFEIEQVPHFRLFADNMWQYVYTEFLWSVGFSFEGTGYPGKSELRVEDSFDGFFSAAVGSKNFEGKTHSVVIDMQGVVVHDPSPTKKYQGENVLESGALLHWALVSRRTDESWLNWTK